ncbi:MAG: AAA family ATPase [Mollicutes bacterium]|nr:MAG: AAA family ATPase [Mollicutes bacterium]
MLKTIRIKNFRSIQDSGEISLTSGITILVGQNESGKTSILEAINYFGNFFTNGFIRKPFLGENNFDEPFVDYELNADLVLQNSKVQTAEFTYSTNKQFRQRLQKLATKKIFLKNAGIQKFYISNLKNLENIKEYKISLHIDCTKNNNIAEIDIDNRFLLFFSKILKKKEEKNNQIKTARTILTQKEVAKII